MTEERPGTQELEIVYVKAQDLKEADYNPRELTTKDAYHLTESLLLFGFADPVIRNLHPTRHNVVVGGHQRRTLALQFVREGVELLEIDGQPKAYPDWHELAGEPMQHGPGFMVPGCRMSEPDNYLLEVPTVAVSLELPREMELNLRLNRNHGRFDKDKLANYYEPAELLSIGFNELELGIASYEPSDVTAGAGSDDSPDGKGGGRGQKPMTPHFIINFDSPESAQAVHAPVQELLDRLLPDHPAVIVVRGMGDDGNGPAPADEEAEATDETEEETENE